MIEAEIEHVQKNIALISEGRAVDESVVDHTNTPQKRRSSQGDQPPSKSMAQMVAKKNLDMEKEMPEEIEGYQKGDTYCKICNSEENTHYQLVKHYHKYHENKASFVCNKCGKGFLQRTVIVTTSNATARTRRSNARITHVHNCLHQNWH